MRDVRFWSPDEQPYGALSNLYPSPVKVDGVRYRTAEHAIKAAQAKRPEVKRWLMAAPSAELAAGAAEKLPKHETAAGWTAQRIPVMRRILAAKFRQHADLRALLLGTGARRIVEYAPTDDAINRFWSEIKGSGAGRNMLGKLLMEMRAELRREAAQPRDGKRRNAP